LPCILSRHVALAEFVLKYCARKFLSNLTQRYIAIAVTEMFNSVPSEMHRRASQSSLEFTWEIVLVKRELEITSIVRDKK